MKSEPCTIFIYYQVDARRSEAVLEAMQAHSVSLAERGVSLKFSRRFEEKHGLATWMETCTTSNRAEAERISGLIESSAREAGLDALAPNGRTLEFFVPVNP